MCALLLLGGACKRHNALTDRELAEVFRDAFLSNAYTSEVGLRLDSLRLYEPIFERYGHTTEDVQYTIGSFSTRKSARLSDVVESAIKMLEAEGKRLDREVAILDTINNIAKRKIRPTIIYSDSVKRFRSLADTTAMRVVFEPIRSGEYTLHYDYLVDSLDTSKKRYNLHSWLEKDMPSADTTIIKRSRKVDRALTRGKVSQVTSNITVDKDITRLVVQLLDIEPTKDAEYHATIKNLEIKRIHTQEEVLDSLYQKLLNIKIYDNELLFATPKDSL